MEEYIVSARKYRPASFDTVVGQRALTTTLKNSIASGKLAHAYLFCGPRGVGKTTCARIFAKAINCLHPQADGEACGECESCQSFNEGRSLNIHELDAASNNSVEDIRELCKQVMIPPQLGRYKIFIIDEVHMLSSAAFNAFLKTLEEPPSYVVFILATTEKHKILPTILSRCQVYDFARMSIQNTVDHLLYVAQKEGYTTEPEALNLIAQKADGGMRDALSIFDQMVSFTGGQLTYERVCQSLNVLSTEYYFRFVDHFLRREVEACMLLFNEVLQKGFDGGPFIEGLASHFRDLLVSRDVQTLPLLEVSEPIRARYQEQAQRCQPKFLYRGIKLCNDCSQSYRTSRNKRLQVEICLIQACQLTEDDVPGSGLCPTKKLQPIFQPQASTSQTAAATTATAKPQSVQNSTPQVHKPNFDTKTRQAPLATVVSDSFSHFDRTSHEKGNPTSTQAEKQELVITAEKPLDEADIHSTWFEYLHELPQDEAALAQRMRAMTICLSDADTISITVDNDQVAQMMQNHLPQIEQFMRKKLQHSSTILRLIIAEKLELERKLSKPELYKKMCVESPALPQLVQGLGLEFE